MQHRHHRIEIEVEIYTHDLHVLYFGASCCWIGDGFSSDALFFFAIFGKRTLLKRLSASFWYVEGISLSSFTVGSKPLKVLVEPGTL